MDTTLIAALTNSGALGAVVVLIILGWLVPKPYFTKLEEENRLLREALNLERQRGTDAEQAGRVTGQLIHALQDLAAERRHREQEHGGDGPGLTWKDIS